MRNSIEFVDTTALADDTPRGVKTCSDTPLVIVRRGAAGNDAACGDTLAPADEIEAWARHAFAANGFGNEAPPGTAIARPRFELHPDARHHRALILGDLIAAAMLAVGAFARRAYMRHRQRRQARLFYDELRQLDDHTLRDLGLDRSEMTSVAAEVTGAAEYTRIREVPTFYGY